MGIMGATRITWGLLLVGIVLLALPVHRIEAKRKFDGDFEFAEEDDTRIMKVGDKKKWIHDPNSELCRPLNCNKKKELCLLEDTFTAVCVSLKELRKSGDYIIPKSRGGAKKPRKMRTEKSIDAEDDDAFFDSEDDDEDLEDVKCQECPVVKPSFLCGQDNRTYSSPCRLDYHNCIHRSNVRIACKGFCPCKGKLNRNSDREFTLTPREFHYDNHHYQYLKYTKREKQALEKSKKYGSEDPQRNQGQSSGKQITSNSVYATQDPENNRIADSCPPSSRPAMANRLLDWFSVVMADAKHRRQHPRPKGQFPIGCQSEVRWMFGHLDTDGDGRISLSELYSLEHDQNEPCLKPFLDACDTDRDIFVNGPEWCNCFSKAERPCAAIRKRSSPEIAPACDSRGYYKSTQCHRGLGICWCVDPHGVEFAGTRTHGSKPNCDTIVNKAGSGNIKTNNIDSNDIDNESDNDDEDVESDISQDLEGSADDQPLDF